MKLKELTSDLASVREEIAVEHNRFRDMEEAMMEKSAE